MKLILLALSFSVAVNGQSTTYCDPSLCSGQSNVHIACPGVAVNKCPADVKVINMADHKDRLIQKLNQFRHDLARGQHSHLPQAARLAEVRWDDELAYVATVHARQCNFAHDRCRNTFEYPYSGQNLYWSWGNTNPTQILDGAFNSWWSEVKDTRASDIASYPR